MFTIAKKKTKNRFPKCNMSTKQSNVSFLYYIMLLSLSLPLLLLFFSLCEHNFLPLTFDSCWISSLPLDFMFSDWTILNLTTHVDAGVLAQFNAFQSHSLYLAPSRLNGLLFLYDCVSFDCSAFSFHFMYLWFTIRERFQSPIVYFNIYCKCASFQCTRLTHAMESHVCKNPLIGKNLLSCCFQHDFDWMPMSVTPTCALTPFKTFIHSVCGMATNWCHLLTEFSSRFRKQPSSNCFLVMLSISVFINELIKKNYLMASNWRHFIRLNK